MCDSISSFLLILGDGEGEVSLQEFGFVIVTNVFPPKTQFLDNYVANMTRLAPTSHLPERWRSESSHSLLPQ